jgi:hypothetical protein
MTSVHLLAAALFICSVPAFAQQNATPSNSTETQDQEKPAWKLSFDAPTNFAANDGLRLFSPDDSMSPSGGRVIPDTVCYKIRSYVVARDNKDSDSVHPVSYSTCQPASRYRLRTTEMSTPSLRR